MYDFAELIGENYYFIDKSLLIKERLDCGACATLWLRPRGFGKTVNISMMRYFFEKTEKSNRHLFDGLKIADHPECMAEQGQYPVVFLTFKGVEADNWELCYKKICDIIGAEYKRHFDVIKPHLDARKMQKASAVVDGTAPQVDIKFSLKKLTTHLRHAYGQCPIVLIDEYDDMMQVAFEHGYFKELVHFMFGFLSAGLKGNSDLEFGILSSILLMAKEDYFSGSLNHLLIRTVLNSSSYSDKFGFLESEVSELLEYFGMSTTLLPKVCSWYGGYQCGDHKMCNPRSTVNFLENGIFQPYWNNSNDLGLLNKLLQCRFGGNFEQLIIGGKLVAQWVDQYATVAEQREGGSTLWGLLLMKGFLSFENYRSIGFQLVADLKIPNAEVSTIYNTQILSWFETSGTTQQYQSMLQSLVDGQVANFQERFGDFALQTLSVFDIEEKNPEKFYHGLELGMLASLRDTHEVVSNRESGWGRYDVSIFPKDVAKPGIIFEFKVVDKKNGETLEGEAKAALNQIEDRNYEAAMRARGITNIIKLGIGFNGKESLVLIGANPK